MPGEAAAAAAAAAATTTVEVEREEVDQGGFSLITFLCLSFGGTSTTSSSCCLASVRSRHRPHHEKRKRKETKEKYRKHNKTHRRPVLDERDQRPIHHAEISSDNTHVSDPKAEKCFGYEWKRAAGLGEYCVASSRPVPAPSARLRACSARWHIN